MSRGPDHDFPPWVADAIRACVGLAVARKWVPHGQREDLVQDVWLHLLADGETPATVAAKPPGEVRTRILTLANRSAAATARRNQHGSSQADALEGFHDESASPDLAAEIRDTLDWIARRLQDAPVNARPLVCRTLAHDPSPDPDMVRAFAEKIGLTTDDLTALAETNAMTPTERQTLHRLRDRLRAVLAGILLLFAAESAVARPAPATAPQAAARGHWN